MKHSSFLLLFSVLVFAIVGIGVIVLVGSVLPERVFVAQVAPGPNEAVFYVVPETGNFLIGSSFSVQLKVNSSVAITSVKAYLDFNPALLSATLNTTGTAFPNIWEATVASGKIKFQGSAPTPGVSGEKLVATINFQAIGAGSATFTYDTQNVLALKPDDTNILNVAQSKGGTYTISANDTTSPTASITINSGAAATNSAGVTLSLTCADASGVKDVRYSNDGVFDTEPFESFAATKSWSLTTGDGTKTVSYQCRDNSSNQNTVTVSDSIVLDATAPSVPSGISYSPNPNKTGTHVVNWSAASDGTGSGVAGYDIRRSSDGTSWTIIASGVTATSFTQNPAVGPGTYIYQVRAKDNAGNTGSFSANTNTVVVDTTPPTISTFKINGGAAATASPSVTLDVSCSDASGLHATPVRYTNSSSFGSESFEALPAGGKKSWTLSSGDGTKTVLFQCQDILGNVASTSASILLDTTPPARTPSSPGILPVGTPSTIISLITDESATCKYSTTSGISYDAMASTFAVTGGVSHSSTITGLQNGTDYTYFVKCTDALGNKNTTDSPIAFSVASQTPAPDTEPPIRTPAFIGTLAAGTTSTPISLTTNEPATCKYSTTAGLSYDDATLTTFSTTGATSHSATVTGLSDGNNYSYFVKCADVAGNKNADDLPIEFSVAGGDATLPIASITINSGAAATNSAGVTLSLTCADASGVKDVRYSNDGVFDTEPFESFAATKSWSLTTGDGTKTVSYQCRDNSSNQNTVTVSDSIVLDASAPILSNGQPSGTLGTGTSQVDIVVSTNEPATCKYSTVAGISYDAMTSTFATTGSASHSSLVSGLANGNSYTYFVKCADSLGNKNASDFSIQFGVAAPPPTGPTPTPSGTPPPSPTLSPGPTAPPFLKGDFNKDGKVNIFDASLLLSHWKENAPDYNLNSDGIIDIFDASILLSNWTG